MYLKGQGEGAGGGTKQKESEQIPDEKTYASSIFSYFVFFPFCKKGEEKTSCFRLTTSARVTMENTSSRGSQSPFSQSWGRHTQEQLTREETSFGIRGNRGNEKVHTGHTGQGELSQKRKEGLDTRHA